MIQIVFVYLSHLIIYCSGWQVTVDYDFKHKIDSNTDFKQFESIYSRNDYFALLSLNKNNHIDSNEHFIMIGARNYLYKLSLPDLSLISSKSWPSSQFDSMQCLNRSIINNKDECDNYIKLYQSINEDTFRICSTNALNPKCRFYQLNQINDSNMEHSIVLNETSGLGYSPLRAYENKYIYNYIKSVDYLYTANTIDLNRYFTSINKEIDQDRISTNMHDNNWLHRADFVNSFSTKERIFFLFNEDATNTELNQKPIRRIPSIAQICLNDQGASLNSLRNIWTTYLKTRLSCVYDTSKSIDSDESFKFDSTFQSNLFYFDELKSISDLYTKFNEETNKNTTYFYAVFTTSKYSITASAVCLFNLDQIMTSFHGDYKTKSTPLKQTTPTTNIPKPRPSECPSKLTYQHLIFSRKNFIMENDIQSEAIIVETASQSRFQSIDVDFDQNHTDVLFIGTDNGRVLTFVLETKLNKTTNQTDLIQSKVVYSEELNFLSSKKNTNKDEFSLKESDSIINIKLYKSTLQTNNDRFILTTQNRVVALEAHYCYLKTDSLKCDQFKYPYCKWSINSNKCLHKDESDQDNDLVNNTTHANVSNLNQISSLISIIYNQTNLTAKSMQIVQRDDSNEYLFDLNNSKLTISMNIVLFVFALSSFLILSFLIGILTSYFIYSKSSKFKIEHLFNKFTFMNSINKANLNTKNNNKISNVDSANDISVNDLKKTDIDCSQLYSTVKSKTKRESNMLGIVSSSVFTSSASSLSPVDESITKSTIISIDNDPRYVYVNSKQANLSILGLIDHTYESARIDENDYFSLRKSHQKNFANNMTPSVNLIQTTTTDMSSASSSSSSPNSAQTSYSTTKLVKPSSNKINNNYEISTLNYTLPSISVQLKAQQHQLTLERNNTFNKKYYI